MEFQRAAKTNRAAPRKRSPIATGVTPTARAPMHPILQLQQKIGNRAVGRLIQAKLRVGQPGDQYEQEADRVAEVVMRESGTQASPGFLGFGRIQSPPIQGLSSEGETERLRRQPEEEEEEETSLQTKLNDDSSLIQRQMEEEEEPEEEEANLQAKPNAESGLLQRQRLEEEEPEEEKAEETLQTKPAIDSGLLQGQIEEEEEPEEEEEATLQTQLNLESGLIQRQRLEEEEPEEEQEILQTKLSGESGLIQRQMEEEEEEEEATLQTKLETGQSAALGVSSSIGIPQIQRVCTECAEELEHQSEKEEATVQPKASDNRPPQQLESLSGMMTTSASPLSSKVREKVEPILGADLSDVRVHSTTSDRSLAHALGAKAFTHKNHIWIGENQSPDDLELMAHEASHVVQQTSGSAPVQRLQRKPSDYQHPEDGGGVQSRLNRRFEEEIGDSEAAAERGDESGASPAGRSIDRAEVRSRSGELQGDTRPDVNRPAQERPQVEQAAAVTQQEAESPPEQIVQGESQAQPELNEAAAGQEATSAAEQAAGLAEQAFAVAAAQPEPSPEVEVQPPELIVPVDAAGDPLEPDPEADAAVMDIADRIQYLRERGTMMRTQAAEGHANAEIIRGNVARVSSEVSKAEQGITTAQEHSQYRREVIAQAEQAVGISEEKQATVAAQAPGFQSKADEGKEDSGPMASEASSLVSENASKTPDDPEAAEKSREQGQKMNRVSSDAATIDSAISQTRSRADSLVEDAARAAELNTQTRGHISSGQQQLEQTTQRLSQHQAQASQARGQVEGMAGAADALHTQATQLDEQGKQIVASSFALEERLGKTQQSYAAGMNAIPPVEPWEGEIPGAAEEGTIQMREDESQSSEVAPVASTSPATVPTTPASSAPAASTTASVMPAAERPSVPETSVATGLEPGASAAAEPTEEAPAAQPETVGEGETTAVTGGTAPAAEEEAAATTDPARDLAASVELGPRQERVSLESEIPPWLTEADPRSVQNREQRQQQLDNQRRQEVAWFNQELAGRSVAQIGTGERFQLVGRALGRRFQNITKNIKWPGWGGLAKMLLDPRSHLVGIVGGLSMILSGGSNLLSAEQWHRDPLGNLLTSAANIATGIAIILGTITAIAGLVIAILGALILLSFGALAAPFAGIIAFCTTVITTVGGWAIAAGKIALVLQALALIKNLIDVATAQTADQLQRETEEVSGNISGSFQAVMSIVGAKGAQAGLSKLSSRVSRVTAAREAVGRSSRALARQTFARGGQAIGRGIHNSRGSWGSRCWAWDWTWSSSLRTRCSRCWAWNWTWSSSRRTRNWAGCSGNWI